MKFINSISIIYSSLTLVLAICEGSHISPKNKFSSYLTLYIVPHIPKALGICEKKFQRFSLKNLWAKTEKSMKKLSPIVFEFIRLMASKTTASTSPLTSFLRFWKHCTIARNICDSLCYFFIRFANFSGYTALFSKL